MITWHEELDFDFSNPVTDRTFTEDAIFFDIETTGFSPARTSLYLIGCATRNGNRLCLDQFFAESPDEEKEVLSAFFSLWENHGTVITFNGIGFDIPYLKAKCKTLHLPDPFDTHSYIDLYKEAARMKFLFRLPDFKQKTIETFLAIDRVDAYSGGELIEVYKEYVKLTAHTANSTDKNHISAVCEADTSAAEALAVLRQHNYEDVLYMPYLLPLLSYQYLFDGNFSVAALAADEYTDMNGNLGKELFFTLDLSYAVPTPVSLGFDDCYLSLKDNTARLRVRLFDGELRYFFDNPKDYYYLPGEDMAVLKSVAAGVDREHRVQATAANCYTRKHAIFLPQYEELFTPAYRMQARDKTSYFELSKEFASSDDLQHRYVCHLLKQMQKSKTQ